MGVVIILALVAVLLGGLLGLGRHSEAMLGPLRVFSLVAVAALVLLHILPDALAAGGVLVLLAAAVAFALPALWPRITRRVNARKGLSAAADDPEAGRRAMLELAYVSLLVHKVADGIGLGVILGHEHGLEGHWGLATGLLAHTVPMAAVVAVAFGDRGRTHAWSRVVGLAGAIVLGLTLAELLHHGPFDAVRPFIDAMAAGLLLHIVFHDLPRPRARRFALKLGEVFALALGLAVTVFGLTSHGHHDEPPRAQVVDSLTHLALDMAPMLALGLILGALVQASSGALPTRWLASRTSLGAATRGALISAPHPTSVCGVLPITAALATRGVAPAALLGFLFAAPALGADTLLMTGQLFGWPWAIARVLGAVGVAILAGWLITRLIPRPLGKRAQGSSTPGPTTAATAPPTSSPGPLRGLARRPPPTRPTQPLAPDAPLGRVTAIRVIPSGPGHAHDEVCGHDHLGALTPLTQPGAPWPTRFLRALLELIEHTGPWMVLGLIAAAYVDALLPASSLSGLPPALAILAVTLVALPTYVCATSATPLAAVLVMKGLSPGAALVGLLLGPAVNLATLGFVSRRFGRRAAMLTLGAVVLVLWALGLALDAGLVPTTLLDPETLALTPPHTGALGVIALATLALITLVSVWRSGLASWLDAIHGHHDHGDHPIHAHDAMDAILAERAASAPPQRPT